MNRGMIHATKALVLWMLFAASAFAQSIPPERLGVFAELSGFASGLNQPSELRLVTSLQDSGPGTLREALSEPGGWIIFDPWVFSEDSQLVLHSPITPSIGNVIDGRGANVYITNPPGLATRLFWLDSVTDFAFVRLHVGKQESETTQLGDCISITNDSDRIWVHGCLFTGGGDEAVDLSGSAGVTVSESTFFGLYHPISAGHAVNERYPDGDFLGRMTLSHSLFKGCNSRQPQAYCLVHMTGCVVRDWSGNGARARATGRILSQGNKYQWSIGSASKEALWHYEGGSVRSIDDVRVGGAIIQESMPEDVTLPPGYAAPPITAAVPGPSAAWSW